MLNKELLERVKQRILREAEFVDMADYLRAKVGPDGNLCGTVGCIAGHAILEDCRIQIKQTSPGIYQFTIDDKGINPYKEAKEALGLTYSQSWKMFTCWPQYINDEVPGTRGYAAAVVRWIDECVGKIESGELK